MTVATLPPPPQDRVLVLQGGGALGSYQAGVFEALDEAGLRPGWVAGISIGAINAALIAGNPPELRVERLRTFWEQSAGAVTCPVPWGGDQMRALWNEAAAGWIAAFGVPGFFRPRVPPAVFAAPGTPEAISLYDTSPLRETLERLVDFERINAGEIRLSVGAVNVRTGNFTYFDNTKQRIGPEHIMASGALPPGFPPVEIDGDWYWDGGVVSNTPLQYVLDEQGRQDLLIFQLDLFSARGELPRTLAEAIEREKDIRYSSRTRLNTDANLALHRAKVALRRVLDALPPELATAEDMALLHDMARENAVTVVQLIYRSKVWEGNSKDYEFSEATMREHWAAGAADVQRTLHRRDLIHAPRAGSTTAFDPGGQVPAINNSSNTKAEP